ncbi:MAG: GNAT family N-acetyltransferase [Candidatus Thermoplasmatota archaeon]|mgnify:CR=1 FL=1
MELSDLLHAALAFEHTWTETGCKVERRPYGALLRNDRYPLVLMANMAWVERVPEDGIEEVLADLDRVFAGTAVRHRYLVFDAAQAAFGEQEALARFGFLPDAVVAMARLGIPACITNPDLEVREVGTGAPETDFRKVWLATREEMGWTPDEARQVYELDRERAAAVGQKAFVSYLGGEPAGTFALWARGTSALVEDVAALPRFRMKGVGRTMIFDACKRAVNLGCEWTLLMTPLVGSPQIMYKTLGFQPVGEIRSFLKVETPGGPA